MSDPKTVTLTEKDLITSAAKAAANLIKDIQTQETYTDATKTVLTGEVSEVSMVLTAYLVSLLFGNTTEKKEKENTPNEKRD